MAKNKLTKEDLTYAQLKVAEADIETIRFWRQNPVIACRDLFGVILLDYQAYIFTRSWFASTVVWLITRNGGKTLLASIYINLRAILFEDYEVWIVSATGRQAKKLFSYSERLAKNEIRELGDVPDIFFNEIKRPHKKSTGFSHDPQSYRYELLNTSRVSTMNSIAENNRGERARLLVLDESGFMREEQIVAVEPFTLTDNSFRTSADKYFDVRAIPKKMPNQRLYISSASSEQSYYYKKYVETAKKMLAGDINSFVADISIEVPLNPTLKGKKYIPLLSRSIVDDMLNTNPTKAEREYFNKFDIDGGESQILKAYMFNNNSTFYLPEVVPNFELGESETQIKYGLAYDPAYSADNAVVGVGKYIYDTNVGWKLKIVNMVNFKDLDDKDGNKQLQYPQQLEKIREYIRIYNGGGAEYENILKVSIDAGSGGGGLLYSHNLMLDYEDEKGDKHRGIIDKEYYEDKLYEFPNAYPCLRMVNPNTKNTMVNRLIDLMELGLIEFPFEYNNAGYVDVDIEVKNSFKQIELKTERVNLSKEQDIALKNIDLCKEESKMIEKVELTSTTGAKRVTYRLRKEVERKMHDDRFYVLLLLANELYYLRDDEKMSKNKGKKKDSRILRLFTVK